MKNFFCLEMLIPNVYSVIIKNVSVKIQNIFSYLRLNKHMDHKTSKNGDVESKTISEEFQDRSPVIRLPFTPTIGCFTESGRGKGSGVGLPVCYNSNNFNLVANKSLNIFESSPSFCTSGLMH